MTNKRDLEKIHALERDLQIGIGVCGCGMLLVLIQLTFAYAAMMVWFYQGTTYMVVPFDKCEQDCDLFTNSKTLDKVMDIERAHTKGFAKQDKVIVIIVDDAPVYDVLNDTPPVLNNAARVLSDAAPVVDETTPDLNATAQDPNVSVVPIDESVWWGFREQGFPWVGLVSAVAFTGALLAYAIALAYMLSFKCSKLAQDEKAVEKHSDIEKHKKQRPSAWEASAWTASAWEASAKDQVALRSVQCYAKILIAVAGLFGFLANFVVNVISATLTSIHCEEDVSGTGLYAAGNMVVAAYCALWGVIISAVFFLICLMGYAFLLCDSDDDDDDDDNACNLNRIHFCVGLVLRHCCLLAFLAVVAILALWSWFTQKSTYGIPLDRLGFLTGVGGECVFKADKEFHVVQGLLWVTFVTSIIGVVLSLAYNAYKLVVKPLIGLVRWLRGGGHDEGDDEEDENRHRGYSPIENHIHENHELFDAHSFSRFYEKTGFLKHVE